jgi:hypothetical protein
MKTAVEFEQQMYSEQMVEGRGVGCVAERLLAPGELVLWEEPALKLDLGARGRTLEGLLSAFREMTMEKQKEYLGLANKYDEDPGINI